MSAPLVAVLFDLDGTLTDTERDWEVVIDEVAAQLGGAISAAARSEMVGLPMWPSIGIIHREVGVDRDWQLTADELLDRLASRYRERVPLRPGAAELLAAVREAGLRTALVTATERVLVELMLDALGHDNFDVVVTGTDVGAAKPDPEPYRLALELLGVNAAQAVAIEDSPHGTLSATAAGLLTVVVPSEILVPAGERRVFADSLSGMTAAVLRSIHQGPRGGAATTVVGPTSL